MRPPTISAWSPAHRDALDKADRTQRLPRRWLIRARADGGDLSRHRRDNRQIQRKRDRSNLWQIVIPIDGRLSPLVWNSDFATGLLEIKLFMDSMRIIGEPFVTALRHGCCREFIIIIAAGAAGS
jgi:hypothetical protein